jgi:hypothetical protein
VPQQHFQVPERPTGASSGRRDAVMAASRHALVALLAIAIAACGAGAAPVNPATQPTTVSKVTLPPVTAAPAVTRDPPTEPPTPKHTPKPTPIPVPPKPTGLKFDEEIEAICTDDPREMCGIGDSTYTLSWKAPRTKGIEIRVYGLLECLSRPENPPDSSDGPCLVEGTKLPSSAKNLIAKAKASVGVVSWKADQSAAGCDMAEQILGPDGEVFYAIVLAAYNTAEKPSVFAIAAPGEWWTPEPGDMPC